METENILFGIISVVLLVLIFLLFKRIKKNKNALIKGLKEYTTIKGYKLDRYEYIGHCALGIDKSNRLAFFIEKEDEEIVIRQIDLTEMLLCRANKEQSVEHKKGKKKEIIQRVDITFYPNNKKNEVISFQLYDKEKRKKHGREFQLANKWVSSYIAVIYSSKINTSAAEVSE